MSKLKTIARMATTKLTHPWDKIAWGLLIFLIAVPAIYILIISGLWMCIFILDHIGYGYTIDWIAFSALLIFTLAILLIHYALSKKKSLSRLINWTIAIIFIEVVVYIWLDAWNWKYIITDLSLDDSVVGYAQPIEDRLEIIMTYVEATFKTIALTSMLVVGKLFTRQK